MCLYMLYTQSEIPRDVNTGVMGDAPQGGKSARRLPLPYPESLEPSGSFVSVSPLHHFYRIWPHNLARTVC